MYTTSDVQTRRCWQWYVRSCDLLRKLRNIDIASAPRESFSLRALVEQTSHRAPVHVIAFSSSGLLAAGSDDTKVSVVAVDGSKR